MDFRFRLHFRRHAGHGPYGHDGRRRFSRPHDRYDKRGLAVARSLQAGPKAWRAHDDAGPDGELSSDLRLQTASACDCSVLGSEEVAMVTEPDTIKVDAIRLGRRLCRVESSRRKDSNGSLWKAFHSDPYAHIPTMHRRFSADVAEAASARHTAGRSFAELDIVSASERTGDPTSGDHHDGYRSALSRRRS